MFIKELGRNIFFSPEETGKEPEIKNPDGVKSTFTQEQIDEIVSKRLH
jgi:hypothetical protein